MSTYSYRAVNALGRISRGNLEASGENELAHHLAQSGLELIEAKENAKQNFLPRLSPRKSSSRALASFCSGMRDMLLSGTSFTEALRDSAPLQNDAAMSEAISQTLRSIDNGGGIEASFSMYPHLFPPIFTAMIGAGERSGDMLKIFNFLAIYAENSAKTEERLRRALRYPLFLLFIAGGSTTFMMTMVVPQIAQFLSGLNGQLPIATRILLAISCFISDHGIAIIALLALLACSVFAMRKFSPAFAIAFDKLILKIPAIGKIARWGSTARFARSFSILFCSGCDIQTCIRKANEAVSNRYMRRDIEEAEKRVVEGSAISVALGQALPSFAAGLIRTGELSGDLGKSLDDLANACDREAQNAVDAFIGMLEPSLTLMIGGILVWTVAAALAPLYGSLSILGGRM